MKCTFGEHLFDAQITIKNLYIILLQVRKPRVTWDLARAYDLISLVVEVQEETTGAVERIIRTGTYIQSNQRRLRSFLRPVPRKGLSVFHQSAAIRTLHIYNLASWLVTMPCIYVIANPLERLTMIIQYYCRNSGAQVTNIFLRT